VKEENLAVKNRNPGNRIIELLQSSALGGILLIAFTLIALLWANSPWKESYHQLWHAHIGFEAGSFKIDMHLLHLINDGLMAVFFYLVGLEIKREFISGELSTGKKAALPALGALGGMLVPAAIYAAVVSFSGEPGLMDGWGIPMATDIAFSLGVISLLGNRIALPLKVFLVALAIVDDLGAILVIALFYTSGINLFFLGAGLGLLALLFVMERLNFRMILVYHLVGLVIWYFFFKSGVHATIAGVLLALVTPMRRELGMGSFRKKISSIDFDESDHPGQMLTKSQLEKINLLKSQIRRLESPLQRLEHDLHDGVNYFIMPLFALANAGVSFGGETPLFSPVTLAVTLGLLLGKPAGITFFAWLGCRLRLAELPAGIRWKHLLGVAILAGIGFTMAIFISTLAFREPRLQDMAKTGIFAGSLVAGLSGYFLLRKMFPGKGKPDAG